MVNGSVTLTCRILQQNFCFGFPHSKGETFSIQNIFLWWFSKKTQVELILLSSANFRLVVVKALKKTLAREWVIFSLDASSESEWGANTRFWLAVHYGQQLSLFLYFLLKLWPAVTFGFFTKEKKYFNQSLIKLNN